MGKAFKVKMVATPIRRRKVTRKRVHRFTRNEFEDYPGKLSSSWRRPRGIDSAFRRRFRGQKPLVNIGYGNNKKTRHMMRNGFKRFLIRCPADLEVLLMNNRVFAGEIASNISARKREQIVNRARELNVNLTNAKAKVATEERVAEE